MTTRVWIAVMSVVASIGSIAFAQATEQRSDDRSGPTGPSAQAGEPGQHLRERLRQRQEQMRRAQERLDRAVSLLDEGANPDTLREEFPEFFRSRPSGADPEGFDAFERPPFGDEVGGAGPGGRGGPGTAGPGRSGAGGGPPERFERGSGLGGLGGGMGTEGRGGRDRTPLDRPMTDEDRAAVREFLKVAQPRLFEMLQRFEREDPAEAQRKLAEAFPRVRPLIELRSTDPALFELRMKDLRLGREAMEAARWLADQEGSSGDISDADRAARQQPLREALAAQFDARTEIMRHDLEMQTRRHDEAKRELANRASGRDEAVDSMMTRLLSRERERLRRGDGRDDPPPMREPGRHRPPGADKK